MKIIKTYKDLKICESEIMDLSISVFVLHLYLISVYDLKILETPNPWEMETLLQLHCIYMENFKQLVSGILGNWMCRPSWEWRVISHVHVLAHISANQEVEFIHVACLN